MKDNKQTKVPGPQASTKPSGLLPVEEARSRILAGLLPLESEAIPLQRAAGRVGSEDVRAVVSHPPFPVSAMDGYALRAEDVHQLPVRLRNIGVSRAGERFHGALEAGTCVRIFTGGIVPPETDIIAIQEEATERDGTVTIANVPKKGAHIRRAGLDFAPGQVCVEKGRVLTARDIGLIASSGHAYVSVRRQPRIAILSTGDELVSPGVTPGPDQIIGSNGIALAAAVTEWGGEPIELGIASDRVDAIAAAAERARGADILVTTGGASVGDHDLVQKSIVQHGFVRNFWQIAMRPGKPLIFGHMGSLPILGLPGNPVSALVCAFLFLRPAIRTMLGLRPAFPAPEVAVLGEDMPANDKREDYVRSRVSMSQDGLWVAHPFPIQDSSMLMTLASADGLIRRAPFAPAASRGDAVDIFRFGSPGSEL